MHRIVEGRVNHCVRVA